MTDTIAAKLTSAIVAAQTSGKGETDFPNQYDQNCSLRPSSTGEPYCNATSPLVAPRKCWIAAVQFVAYQITQASATPLAMIARRTSDQLFRGLGRFLVTRMTNAI